MNKLLLCSIIMLLAACSSSPVQNINYYLLSDTSALAAENRRDPAKPIVVLKQVRLSGYLDRANLAMQLKDHQLYYSKQDFWAEPLQLGIQKALLADMSSAASPIELVSAASPLARQSHSQLSIQIDHFISTYQSQVLISGQYWLQTTAQEEQQSRVEVRAFKFVAELHQDGYAHSVSQLRALVTQMSQQVSETSKAMIENGVKL
ncbi:ABC-type transport auxiliary lipoprotein family protein [Aliiglaciecola sp. LCG003]|uniref:PqiC family protein n=1 Tax=Aliiglaciecola sp. LCG003 TaxID=3053655 RepID=UPI002572EA04|nr:ABC-type transport auxiliary lipoprotein family protein [Aliiglaciecola sp. LCG003]WJG08064.1 ABC-type transport auxiliary lipoprotein family protein [Aliiglaciecola sp. LCG003]